MSGRRLPILLLATVLGASAQAQPPVTPDARPARALVIGTKESPPFAFIAGYLQWRQLPFEAFPTPEAALDARQYHGINQVLLRRIAMPEWQSLLQRYLGTAR